MTFVKAHVVSDSFVAELHCSHNNDSTGSHSAGSSSTTSPVDDVDYDASDYVMAHVITYGNQVKHNACLEPTYDQSLNEMDRTNRLRKLPNRSPRPKSSTLEGVMYTALPQTDQCRRMSPNYYQGQNFSPQRNVNGKNDVINAEESDSNRKSRQQRSKPSYTRSSSVGSITPRNRDFCNPDFVQVPANHSAVLSPRTQLRNARQNLKKVKADKNWTFSPQRSRGKSITAVPQNTAVISRDNAGSVAETVTLRHSRESRRAHQRIRPFSVIENINRFELVASMCAGKKETNNTESGRRPNCDENNAKKEVTAG